MLELGGLGADAKILQFRDISTYMKCFYSATFVATACVCRKVSVSSNNHMMHPLTISGNRYIGAQHRFIMADSFIRISGGPGVQPLRFLQSKGIEIPKNIKISNANLYRTSPLYYRNSQQETMAHPGPH